MQDITSLLNQIENKKLLIIFPHPDDETVMASGLILKARDLGWQIKVISVTNGVLGQIHIHGQGRNMVQIRKAELTEAMRILGVTDFAIWRHCDGLLDQLTQWQTDVSQVISQYQPGIVLTYGADGASGHPDHLALGKQIFELWKQQEDWLLVWPSFSQSALEFLQQKTLTSDRVTPGKYQIKLTPQMAQLKQQALQAHQSQNLSQPLDWLAADSREDFAMPDREIIYNFNPVAFDLGLE